MTTADDTRQQRVIEVADKLFYAHGIQAVGMDAVRTAAGVPLKRIYSLFSSKDDLVVAVLRHRAQLWDDGLYTHAEPALSARDRILSIFDFLDAWFRETSFRGCGFINAYGELGPTSAAVAETVREQKATFQEYVARLVADAGAPPGLAPQIALLAEGAQTTAAITCSPEPAQQAREAAATLLDYALAGNRG